jgi:hypothetical protein
LPDVPMPPSSVRGWITPYFRYTDIREVAGLSGRLRISS